ncbi:MAG: IS630 family transposase [Ignavibacteriaceae bacterium]|nr:IS630 family transposase [Ignavibacteriaceae bacterium]
MNKRETNLFFSYVNIKDGEVFAKRAKRGNARTFILFLTRLMQRYPRKKIIMILDNIRYHHSKLVMKFLKKNNQRIEFWYLSAYSQDLNPIERIWWYMRRKITHNLAVESMEL